MMEEDEDVVPFEERIRRSRGSRKAFGAMKNFYRHIRDADGHHTVSTWYSYDLPPLQSFQVYVTYDLSKAEDSELEELAWQLCSHLLESNWDYGRYHVRFDIHIVGPEASREDCVAHYRHKKENPPEDPSMQIKPSYVAWYSDAQSLFFMVTDPGWRKDNVGLNQVWFDCPKARPQDVHQRHIPVEEGLELWQYVNDDGEGAYEAAVEAGLTDWTSGFSKPVKHYFRHLHANDGHLILSVWTGSRLPPMYSFQFYITFDMSGAGKSELEAYAQRLRERLLDDRLAAKPIRFDVHVVGLRATLADCISDYRYCKENEPNDPSTRIVPSYNHSDKYSYHSYLFMIHDSNCIINIAMEQVAFDPVDPPTPFTRDNPVFTDQCRSGEVRDICKNIYESVDPVARRFVEGCEAVYEESKEEGLTEWL